MSRSIRSWTTHDLELYHDGEMDAAVQADLGDALRSDPGLRERLASVCRVDDELRAVFDGERVRLSYRNPSFRVFAQHAAVAACLLAAMSLTWWFVLSQRSSPDVQLAGDTIGLGTPIESEYQAVRVVFSLSMEQAERPRAAEHESVSAPQTGRLGVAESWTFQAKMDRMLVTGQIDGAIELLDDASRNDRRAAYSRIGELLRSAQSAEQILDRLSTTEQMAVCLLWAREPVAQSAVFGRLQRFASEPELSADVRAIVVALNEDPSLRIWLQAYALADHGQTEWDGNS